MSSDDESHVPETSEDAEGRQVAEPAAAEAPSDPEPSAAEAAPEPEPAAAPADGAQAAAPALPAPPHGQPPVSQQFAHHPYTGPVPVGQYPPVLLAPRIPSNRWRMPEAGAPQYITFACAVVALFGGAAAFHGAGVGIGLALTGIAMVAVPMLAGGRESPAVRVPGAVLVAGLWSVAAVRDAGWIVALCAITALLLTPLILAPPSRLSGIALAAFGYPGGLAGAFRWANRGYRRSGEGGNAMRNLRVIAITVGLLVVFGGLFAAADSNFAAIVANLIPDFSPISLFWRTVLACLLFVLVLLWTYMAVARPHFDPENPAEPKAASRFEVAVPLGALNLLFAAFIALQARVLYGGDDYVMETAGLTMAEYARSGFWQLSVVAVLAMGVIAVAAWKAPRRSRADRWVARALLGGLCVMSLAVVASALFRMSRYFESFGLTRLRLWVFTVEIWLAIVFVLILLCCWKLRAWWLPRAVLGSGAAVLLGLAAINPDGVIARYNVDRFEETGKFDPSYAAGLSADAADVLAELPDAEYDCVFGISGPRYDDDRPAMAWNYGWAHGRALAEERPPSEEYDCSGYNVYLGDSIDTLTDPAEDSRAWEEPTEGGADAEPTTTASATAPERPAGAAFFHWDTCDRLDLTGAEEMFGTSAKGDYGVVADESQHDGTFLGPEFSDGAEYAFLECGYYGPGSGYLLLEVKQWSTWERAAAVLEEERVRYDDMGMYEVTDLGSETMAGFTAVHDAGGSRDLAHMFTVDDLTFKAVVSAGPTNDQVENVCRDLAGQLLGFYNEIA